MNTKRAAQLTGIPERLLSMNDMRDAIRLELTRPELTPRLVKLTDTQIFTLTNALRAAAERYKDDADAMSQAGGTYARLVEQFNKQRDDALALADTLEAI